MGKKVSRTLFWASVTIMLCMAVIVGGTFAFWSKTVQTTNHLVAGNLNLTLERTALSKTMLDNKTGYMSNKEIQSEQDAPVDLTTGSGVNVFGIEEGELVVPASCYEATMKITNKGSVAFKYDIIIALKTENNTTEKITELAKQLKVYIDEDANDDVGYVDKGYLSTFIKTESSESTAIVDGKVVISNNNFVKKAKTSFKIKIEFVNDKDDTSLNNNVAMDQKASFDLIVEAVQITKAPTQNSD